MINTTVFDDICSFDIYRLKYSSPLYRFFSSVPLETILTFPIYYSIKKTHTQMSPQIFKSYQIVSFVSFLGNERLVDRFFSFLLFGYAKN